MAWVNVRHKAFMRRWKVLQSIYCHHQCSHYHHQKFVIFILLVLFESSLSEIQRYVIITIW